MLDPTKHNYFKKLQRLQQQGKIPVASIAEVNIYHDNWCAIHRGRYCNCDPDIELRPLSNPDPNRN